MKSFYIIGYRLKTFLSIVALSLSVQGLFAQHPISNALTRLLNTGDFSKATKSISRDIQLMASNALRENG